MAGEGGEAGGGSAAGTPDGPHGVACRPPVRRRDDARLLPDPAPDAALTATNGIFADWDDAKKGPVSPFAPTFHYGN